MAETETMGISAREVMTTDVTVAAPDQSVEDVARELTSRRISGMPVVNNDGALVGVVSEYDIITKHGRRVDDIMSRSVITVTEDADAQQVAGIMALHGIRRVPVVRDGRVVGIISRSDMVRLITTFQWRCPECGNAERGFARPARCAQCGATNLQLVRE